MIHEFALIKDFDLYEQKLLATDNMIFKNQEKQNFLKQTSDNDLQTFGNKLKTRSLKDRTLSIETSFHQNILEKHFQAFEKEFQKYFEHLYPHSKKVANQSQFFSQDHFQTSKSEKIKEIIIREQKLFKEEEKNQFLTDLYFEENLHEFLLFVCNYTHSGVASELLFLAKLFWQMYIQNQQTDLSEDQINQIVNQVLKSEELKKFYEGMQFLNFKKARIASKFSQQDISQSLEKFIEFYGKTILLVIEQYFYNNFPQETGFLSIKKRSFEFMDIPYESSSEDEEDFDYYAKNKKRKTR